MQQPFTKTGGARVGWINASWPLVRISVNPSGLTITGALGCYVFTPDQVVSIERYALVPVVAWGIRIRHCVPSSPRRVIFWSFSDPDTLLNSIRNAGFIPAATVGSSSARNGIPLRWPAIIVSVALWNALFIFPFMGVGPPVPGWRGLIPLFAVLGFSIGALYLPGIQRLILKPGRDIGEIKAFLYLLIFISSLLGVVFTILLATGAFRPNIG